MVLTGDVEGKVLDEAGRPVRGVELRLLDSDGKTVGDARTEFDGYYSFSTVPGGSYQVVRMNPMGAPEPLKTATLDAERGYVTVDDIVLGDESAATETSP